MRKSSHIVGYDRNGEEYWSKPMPFTWGQPLAQFRGKYRYILSLVFLMDGARTDCRTWVVLGKLSRVKVEVIRPNSLFL